MVSVLDTPIKYLKGVGPPREELLRKELNIHCFSDLLHYYPFRYVDRTKFYSINQIHPNLPYIQVIGMITRFERRGRGANERLVAEFTDGTGIIELVWFKGIRWILSGIKTDTKYIVFGKPGVFMGRINIPHPEIDPASDENLAVTSSLQPVYSTSEKLSSKGLNSRTIARLVHSLLKKITGQVPETLSDEIRKKYGLISRESALLNIHYPGDADILKKATFRIKFEELFFIQLRLLQLKVIRQEKIQGIRFPKVGDYLNRFYKEVLPFKLTEAQKRVMKEIRKDIGSGKQMNRLLQGDVGSGKTIVALMSMLIALDNGYQACIMAPTEILANQHYATISGFLAKLGVKVAITTGALKKKDKESVYERLSTGDIRIIIGTHALIEDNVKFKNLGIAIIDEQHKFGVAQRARLREKTKSPPHVLVMTATPIPRTLAMTIYGDLDVSVIDELPPGRKPVRTLHRYDNARDNVYHFLADQIHQGRQVYFVYPLIKESEILDYKNLENGFRYIAQYFPAPAYDVCMVHGRMKAEEKEKAMERFASGKANILVATNVIEVGVDIRNATIMVIESAERFGLSQLHQLRGRVGRGAQQSYCVLLTSAKLSGDAAARMNIMCRTNDGFEIADADLKQRGPGNLEGTQQSGLVNLRLANLATDGQIISLARNCAADLLKKDPYLLSSQNLPIRKALNELKQGETEWAKIS